MPEFYLIIARKIFPDFWDGVMCPLPNTPHLSPTHTGIIVLVCIVGKCPWVIDWSCSR